MRNEQQPGRRELFGLQSILNSYEEHSIMIKNTDTLETDSLGLNTSSAIY